MAEGTQRFTRGSRCARVLGGLAFWLVVIFARFPEARAEGELPADQQARILSRVLAYDRNLMKRAGAEVALGVVVRHADSAGQAKATRMYQAFKALERLSIQGVPFRVHFLRYTDEAAFRAAVLEHDLDAIYVVDGMEGELGALRRVAREAHLTTMASQSAWVESGLCLAVVVIDNQPRVVLNRLAERAEGAAFGAGFLRLALIVN